MNNNKGQALIESVLVLPGILLIFLLLLSLAYVGFARAWINFQIDRALFCLAEGESEFQCRQETTKIMQRYLPLGQLHTMTIISSRDQWRAQVRWDWNGVHLLKDKTLKWDSSIWR